MVTASPLEIDQLLKICCDVILLPHQEYSKYSKIFHLFNLSWRPWLTKIPLFWEQVFYALRCQDEQNCKDKVSKLFVGFNFFYYYVFFLRTHIGRRNRRQSCKWTWWMASSSPVRPHYWFVSLHTFKWTMINIHMDKDKYFFAIYNSTAWAMFHLCVSNYSALAEMGEPHLDGL